MTKVAITGASGFIGQALTAAFTAEGHDVAKLGRSPTECGLSWRLGEQLPAASHDAEAVIHLASAALAETASMADAYRRDVDGSRLLIDDVRQLRSKGRRIKFIFMSSQSASPEAVNTYGQTKWAIEGLLDKDDEIIVRPGLVYSDEPASVFAMFDKLARMPVVPVVGGRASIQPIHVRELAECVVQIATMAEPPRLVQLGAIEPLTFQGALAATAHRGRRRAPIAIPLPIGPVRLATRVLDRWLGLTLTERVDGLAMLRPMDTKTSLYALGRTLAPFSCPIAGARHHT